METFKSNLGIFLAILFLVLLLVGAILLDREVKPSGQTVPQSPVVMMVVPLQGVYLSI